MPIWLTEFGIQSKPDPLLGVSLARQAEYRRSASASPTTTRASSSFSQYLLRDDNPRRGSAAVALQRLRVRPDDRRGQGEALDAGLPAAAGGEAPRLARVALGPRAPGDRHDDRRHPVADRHRAFRKLRTDHDERGRLLAPQDAATATAAASASNGRLRTARSSAGRRSARTANAAARGGGRPRSRSSGSCRSATRYVRDAARAQS